MSNLICKFLSFAFLGFFSLSIYALVPLKCPNPNQTDPNDPTFQCWTAGYCTGQDSFLEARIISNPENIKGLKYVCNYSGVKDGSLIVKPDFAVPENKNSKLLKKWEWSDVLNGFVCNSPSPEDCPIPAIGFGQQ